MDALTQIFDENKTCLALVGLIFASVVILKTCMHIWKGVRSFLLAPLLKLGVNPKTLGAWAVITGATDGIGKAYAIALAKKGMNIVLISRNADKLAATAQEIESVAKVQTKCVTADFSGCVEIYKSIEASLEGLDIGILVNNVGASYGYPEYFHQLPDSENLCSKILHVNIFSVTFMTSVVLPKMVEKRKGAIVNIGSASCFGFPLLSVYSATKAYVHSFSQNLNFEYADKGIIVQSVLPGFVTTKLSGLRRSAMLVPTPEAYVKCAIESIGRESTTYGYWSHWVMMGGVTMGRALAEKVLLNKLKTVLLKIRDSISRSAANKNE